MSRPCKSVPINSMWYTRSDVQLIFGVSESKAYEIINELANELEKTGFLRPPSGRIQRNLLCKKYNLDRAECDAIVEAAKQTA